MALLRRLLLWSLVSPALSAGYPYLANCVSGGVVDMDKSGNGSLAMYALALQNFVHSYGDLKLMAEGPTAECINVANEVNMDNVHPEDIPDRYPLMKALASDKAADDNLNYLFVFENKDHSKAGQVHV
eukprot:gb/GFBE01016853.1/.p1 GENE.gb/GFBE01016853.1/~~gb/GFBE01016853.1/.p1  ORF type:complete len:128 (+),score=30.02 gb/GFBE01016853.1/:1-384(+)